MSRESLLDKAIVKAKEDEDWQLVVWLRMARGGENTAKWYTIRLNQLSEENAKLREQVTQLQSEWESERDYADQMEAKEKMAVAENDKLRELATEAIRLMQADGPDCGLCKHYSECWTSDAMDYSPSGCVICNEARELGVEVDGFGGLLAKELGKERLVRRAKE